MTLSELAHKIAARIEDGYKKQSAYSTEDAAADALKLLMAHAVSKDYNAETDSKPPKSFTVIDLPAHGKLDKVPTAAD